MKSLRRPHAVPAPGSRKPPDGRVGRRRADAARRTGPRLNVKGGALPPGAHAKGMGTDRPRTDSPANPGIKRSPCLACGLRRGRATFTQHKPTCSTMTTRRTKTFFLPSGRQSSIRSDAPGHLRVRSDIRMSCSMHSLFMGRAVRRPPLLGNCFIGIGGQECPELERWTRMSRGGKVDRNVHPPYGTRRFYARPLRRRSHHSAHSRPNRSAAANGWFQISVTTSRSVRRLGLGSNSSHLSPSPRAQ